MSRLKDPYTNDSYTLLRNHPLLIVAKCKHIRLMEHDYCTQLGIEKFRRFGLILFSIFFVTHVLFVAVYTYVALESKHPFFYYDLYNQSLNGTLAWDYGKDDSICQKVGLYLIASKTTGALKNQSLQGGAAFLYLLLLIFVLKNVFIIVLSFPRIFRSVSD